MRDTLSYTFERGYYSTGNTVDVPEGALLSTSKNVLFDGIRLMSFKGLSHKFDFGGSRAFAVDKDVVVFLGSKSGESGSYTFNEGFGNVVQAVGKSLWFVGNNLAEGILAINSSTGQPIGIGGVNHVVTLEILGESGESSRVELNDKILLPDHITDTFSSVVVSIADTIGDEFSEGGEEGEPPSSGPASSQTNYPGAVAIDTSIGTVSWGSLNDIKIADGESAEAGYVGDLDNPNAFTQILKGTNFGFEVPGGATIDGIEVEIRRSATSDTNRWNARDDLIQLYKGGVLSGTDKNVFGNWPTTAVTTVYGGPTDLWGETWSYSDINDSNFGIGIAARLNDQDSNQINAYVDFVRITVYYTGGGGGNGGGGSAIENPEMVVTPVEHGYDNGEEVRLSAKSILPGGLSSVKKYYVLQTGVSSQLKLLGNYFSQIYQLYASGSFAFISTASQTPGTVTSIPKHGDSVFVNQTGGGLNTGTEYRLLNPQPSGNSNDYPGSLFLATGYTAQISSDFSSKQATTFLNGTGTITNGFTSPSHGFSVGDLVYVTASNAYPSGFQPNTPFYVMAVDTDTFSLGTNPPSQGGSAITIVTGGLVLTVSGGSAVALSNYPTATPITNKMFGGLSVDITSSGTGVFKLRRNDTSAPLVYRFLVNTESDTLTTVNDVDTGVLVDHGFTSGMEVIVNAVSQLPSGLNSTVPYFVVNVSGTSFGLTKSYAEYDVSCTSGSEVFTLTGSSGIQLNDCLIFTGAAPSGFSQNTLYYVVSRVLSSDNTLFTLSETFGGAALTCGSTLSSVPIAGGPAAVFLDNGAGVITSTVNPSIGVMFGSLPAKTVELADGDTLSAVAEKIRNSLRSDSAVANDYFITSSGSEVLVTAKTPGPRNLIVSYDNKKVLGILDNISTVETQGSLSTGAPLSSTPQFCKWNGTTWDSPVQVGLRALEENEKPELVVTTPLTRGSDFEGLVRGSRTAKVARKRYGSVSISTPSSNLVTASDTGDTLLISIPRQDEDGSSKSANSWYLYFTFAGLGSTDAHYLFPIAIPEEELDGTAAPRTVQEGNAKYRVISQHPTQQSSRLVEVEFLDNDLLPLNPEIDYYPASPAKFIAKLGNCLCLIGTGEDLTGFDVSYPNFYEAFPPDWANWLEEVPVSIATEQDLGFFWICTASGAYTAQWVGVTESSAPVLLEKKSSLYGAIGEGASVCVNGMLFVLSGGRTPVMMSPDGRLDDNFGNPVLQFFKEKSGGSYTFDSKTELAWDEATNSIVFACGNRAIAYQLDLKIWSAPIDLGNTETPFEFYDALSLVSFNGSAHVCQFSPETGLKTYQWNEYQDVEQEEEEEEEVPTGPQDLGGQTYWSDGTPYQYLFSVEDYSGGSQTYWHNGQPHEFLAPLYEQPEPPEPPGPPATWPWVITSSFKFGKSFRALKDIVQVEAIISSEKDEGQMEFYARKNYSLKGSELSPLLARHDFADAGSYISVRKFAESIDYDSISAEIRGDSGGQTIHTVVYNVDVHRIERLS